MTQTATNIQPTAGQEAHAAAMTPEERERWCAFLLKHDLTVTIYRHVRQNEGGFYYTAWSHQVFIKGTGSSIWSKGTTADEAELDLMRLYRTFPIEIRMEKKTTESVEVAAP